MHKYQTAIENGEIDRSLNEHYLDSRGHVRLKSLNQMCRELFKERSCANFAYWCQRNGYLVSRKMTKINSV